MMKELNEYTDFLVKETETLLNIDSPTGYTDQAAAWVKEEFTKLGFDAVLTRLNAVVTLDDYRALLEGYLDGLEKRGDLEIHPELLPKPTLDTVSHRQARRMAKWM